MSSNLARCDDFCSPSALSEGADSQQWHLEEAWSIDWVSEMASFEAREVRLHLRHPPSPRRWRLNLQSKDFRLMPRRAAEAATNTTAAVTKPTKPQASPAASSSTASPSTSASETEQKQTTKVSTTTVTPLPTSTRPSSTLTSTTEGVGFTPSSQGMLMAGGAIVAAVLLLVAVACLVRSCCRALRETPTKRRHIRLEDEPDGLPPQIVGSADDGDHFEIGDVDDDEDFPSDDEGFQFVQNVDHSSAFGRRQPGGAEDHQYSSVVGVGSPEQTHLGGRS
eukprot:CAMPEP_0178443096 /NCGR_PEP_ID=MMETSP0689_2-20121128/38635_1 /TAXON_ID=160604 /ORGANISM="Amphidinium massartii, Strain CS-259" /LENGTH=278 /DNA_ID=CAMNT_0020066925 /DNA_START=284 /DNA_END=1120 /DNA_ORIENTATION=+